MSRGQERGRYCRNQAAACAHAATAVALSDVKEAYRNLELGWVQLALEFESELKPPINSGLKKAASSHKFERSES